MKTEIKCVIFDIGNTIIGYDLLLFGKTLKDRLGYVKLSPEELKIIVFDGESYLSYERGEMTTKEFYERIVGRLKSEKITFEEFKIAFCSIFFQNKGINEILRKVSKKHKILFISNISKLHWEMALSENELIKEYFPEPWQQILSFKVGVQKPAAKIFLEALKKAGRLPEEVLFIDDKNANVEGFRRIGGNSSRYCCTEHSIEKLSNILISHGII